MLEALGLVRDERTEKLAGALADRDLGAALEIAREVASDGLDIARFTRETIDTLRERLLTAARDRTPEVGVLTTAVAELAGTDFRRDPGSPVPSRSPARPPSLAPRRWLPLQRRMRGRTGSRRGRAGVLPSAGRRAAAATQPRRPARSAS